MFLQPGEIFVRAGGVHDEQKFLFFDTINDQIIDDSAALVQQKSVLPGADIELVDVVCEHGVEPFARAASFDDQLAHVRNVENPDIVSHGLMLLDDARVLHGHEPSRERHNFRAKPHVLVVKWSPFLCGFAHAQSLHGRCLCTRLESQTRCSPRNYMTLLDKLERRFGFLGDPRTNAHHCRLDGARLGADLAES